MSTTTERHAQLVRFLEEQERLDEIMAEPIVYENVVMTRRDAIEFGGPGIRIDSFVKLEGGEGLYIGRGVHIASFAHVGIGGGKVFLGDFSAVASGARIVSGSNQLNALSMSASAPQDIQRVAKAETRLERYACVLVNSVVLPGVTLHEGAVLAAGGVATRDIPAWELWGGVPARRMRKREVVP
jgi:galactoside O-acetyltransferase